MDKNKTTALETFVEHKENAITLLDQIRTLAEDHMGYEPEEVNWAHAGTMASVVEDLKALAEKVGIDSDEALNG
ncbi:hypothetical protein [Sansalvadorimonas verongulae]|uniref:hypothetical protein n=1 Tax=Sansalvadorimonas verongulae TaxID=2172824 RepID=UPI0012BBBF0F|nr:hypothetical protein [Sansalvadorimonas verongulae]MTI11956.1 hypothetical protein [Sansalvadorimonas verongulae]